MLRQHAPVTFRSQYLTFYQCCLTIGPITLATPQTANVQPRKIIAPMITLCCVDISPHQAQPGSSA